MKKKIGLFLSLEVLLQIFTIRVNADDLQLFTDFDDIKPQYAEAIICVTEAGILSGYPDNTFRPQQFLTRGAAAKIASIMELGVDLSSALVADDTPYLDVSQNHVFAGYIAYCAYRQYINGYTDGTFHPADMLTGYAFAKILLNAIGYSDNCGRYVGTMWKINVYNDATAAGIYSDAMDFSMDESISREQAAWMIFKALNWDGTKNESTQKTNSDVSLPNIVTAYDLQNYLNEKYANGVDLPIGNQPISFSVTKNDKKNTLYDYNITASGSACRAVDNAENLITYSETDVIKSREILKDIQLDVYQIASKAFPSAKLSGGYTWREYRYKYIQEDLFGWAWNSWTNYNDADEYYLHGFGVDLPSVKLTYYDTYITAFHWCTQADGYFD